MAGKSVPLRSFPYAVGCIAWLGVAVIEVDVVEAPSSIVERVLPRSL